MRAHPRRFLKYYVRYCGECGRKFNSRIYYYAHITWFFGDEAK